MERDELIGTWLGQYQVLEQLGEGGMARVYKAMQPRLKRYVAIKVILPEAAARPGFRERFEREAQLIARLQHANIVAVYDFGEVNNLSYLVMQYVGGGSLSSKIKSGEALPYPQAVTYTVQMARALQHAHSQGIIHRDIKPSNMLIDEKDADHLLLSDFGIAKLLSGAADSELGQGGLPQPITTTGGIIGTPEFMAPEQAQGMAIDARTDIYALGMVLYVLLTGSFPFRSTTPLGVLYQQVNTDPPPINTLNPAVPASLVEVVKRALAKRPDQRFQSAELFARALEASLLSASQIDAAPTLLADPGPTLLAPQGSASIPADFTSAPTFVQQAPSQYPPSPVSYTTQQQQPSVPGGAPFTPVSNAHFFSGPTPYPGPAPAIPVPISARPRRLAVRWLIAGASLLLVAALVLGAVRGNLLNFLQAGGASTSSTQTPVTGVITDNFGANTNGWETGNPNGDPGLIWNLGSGSYDITITGSSAHYMTYFPTPHNLSAPPANFTLEIKVEQVQGSNLLGYGLIFRKVIVNQMVNCYAFTINSSGQYEFQVYHMSQANGASFTNAPPNTIKGPGQVNTLKVEVTGNTFKLYANGHLLAGKNQDGSWTDSSFSSGQVGLLVTGDQTQKQEYKFTSFVLTPMP
jgi:serine/threonine protein kinase